ncbi:unnamed protein product [Microthlaspi erraticum]|uniref:Uncharacterized protein n=1 Tax=Microthlaspi erraticum TaxID=1685480 RepID=A0A6D2KW11_9BRAS|nr:unnamed protein product [Microthlaspi erraticum]
MLLLLLLLQSKDNYLVKLFRTPRNSARSSSLKKDFEEEDQERVIEEFCLLLNDDEIVAAEAPGVQIDQPEVHLLWPFTLHQLSSHNKLDRQLDRVNSSSIESDLLSNRFCLILTNRLPFLVSPT